MKNLANRNPMYLGHAISIFELTFLRNERLIVHMTEMKTPRGLKIKLAQEVCEQFELKGEKSLTDIFHQVEKLISAQSWVMLFVGLYMFISRMEPINVMITTFCVSFFMGLGGHIKPIFNINRIISFTSPNFWPGISGWFIDKIALVVVGFLTIGWLGVVLYLAGLVANSIIANLVNFISADATRKRYRFAIWDAERIFSWFLIESITEKMTYREWVEGYSQVMTELAQPDNNISI